MAWIDAEILLRKKSRVNTRLDLQRQFKIVIAIPPYRCKNYANEEGFRIQVGQNSFINIPISIIKKVYQATSKNGFVYNRAIFLALYPNELSNKPCYVHAIGKLFSNAGVMVQITRYSYQIII